MAFFSVEFHSKLEIASDLLFLGTLLIVILPNSLHLSAEQWNDQNVGFILIGLGFFIICLIKECLHLYEFYSISSNEKREEEQLIVRSPSLSKENQLTRLISLVFSLGVHYFFSKRRTSRSIRFCSFSFRVQMVS